MLRPYAFRPGRWCITTQQFAVQTTAPHLNSFFVNLLSKDSPNPRIASQHSKFRVFTQYAAVKSVVFLVGCAAGLCVAFLLRCRIGGAGSLCGTGHPCPRISGTCVPEIRRQPSYARPAPTCLPSRQLGQGIPTVPHSPPPRLCLLRLVIDAPMLEYNHEHSTMPKLSHY